MYTGKVKQSSIDLMILVLINTVLSYFTTSIFTVVRYMGILYLFARYCKDIFKSKVLYSLLAVYSVLLGISSYQNNSSITWGLSGFMYGIQIMTIFATMSGVIKRRKMDEIVTVMIWIILALLIPTDILIVVYPYERISTTVYLIGNKFMVSYMHSLLVLLLSMKAMKRKKAYLTISFLISLGITYKTGCTTGMIMLIFYFLFELIIGVFPKMKVFVSRSALIAIALIAVNILIWGSTAILYTPWANHIIVDVLGKTNNMTGRFRLYAVVPQLIANASLIGYGYQPDVFRNLIGYGNAQNGLIQIVLESGFVGAVAYFGALFIAGKNGDSNAKLYTLYLYLLSFVIGSIAEVNLSTYFVLGVAMLYAFGRSTIVSHTEKKRTKKMYISG